MKLLVVGPAWVGDMVMAQTLFKFLKSRYPSIEIDVLAPAWTEPLLKRMPEVRGIILAPFKHGELRLCDRYRLGRRLRGRYDWAIVMPRSYKSALIPFFAKIPRRTGFLGEWRYGVLNDLRYRPKQHPLLIHRFLMLALNKGETLTQYDTPALSSSTHQVQKTLRALSLDVPTSRLLVLCPGAEYGSSKRWPSDYFAEVAQAKIEQGWQVWMLGSANDCHWVEPIVRMTKQRVINLVGRTTLDQAIDILTRATVVLTNDSGLMHVAAAVNRPLIAIYGSSSPEFTPPLSHQAHIIRLNLSCQPCFKRECPLSHLKCMWDLRPAQVLEVLETFN